RVSGSTGGEASSTHTLYYGVRNTVVVAERRQPLGRFGTRFRRAVVFGTFALHALTRAHRRAALAAVREGFADARAGRLGPRALPGEPRRRRGRDHLRARRRVPGSQPRDRRAARRADLRAPPRGIRRVEQDLRVRAGPRRLAAGGGRRRVPGRAPSPGAARPGRQGWGQRLPLPVAAVEWPALLHRGRAIPAGDVPARSRAVGGNRPRNDRR